MDYTKAPLAFRVRKVARYVRLYGASRTVAKIRANYHMKKSFRQLPPIKDSGPSTKHVGIIGCGSFAHSNLAYYLDKNYGTVIRAAMDTNIDRAASIFRAYKVDYYTDQASRVLSDPRVDLIFIASNHASHADYAVEALKMGKCIHIEKPHVVTWDQLVCLREAMVGSPGGLVRLGFNRPDSPFGTRIQNALKKEEGPTMVNWFVAGHDLPDDHWYYQADEGGRVLGNLPHWIDFTLRLIPAPERWPLAIRPTVGGGSQKDLVVSYSFGGGSLATISFSAKGHTFEGVRERLAIHKGNLLVTMDDFKTMTIQSGSRRNRYKLRHRDHGHEQAVRLSYQLPGASGRSVAHGIDYVWDVGRLTLETRDSVDKDTEIVVEQGEVGRP